MLDICISLSFAEIVVEFAEEMQGDHGILCLNC
jgi:hypothetical protein